MAYPAGGRNRAGLWFLVLCVRSDVFKRSSQDSYDRGVRRIAFDLSVHHSTNDYGKQFYTECVLFRDARFYNPVKRTLFNAFFMSVRHLFQTIGILATDLGIAAATYFGLFYFPQFAMLLFLFGMPLIAFVNSYFFTAIFRKYMPKEEEQEHTDATPLLGEEDEEMKEAIRNLKGK